MKLNKKINLCEFLVLFLVFTSIVFIILAGTGTLFSGFHYVDDHEFAETEFLLKNEHWGIVRTIRSWLVFDSGMRFRPLYYPLRVLTVAVFGINTVAISVLRGFIASLSMTVLYSIGRMTGSNRFFSFLFSLVSIIGYQMAAVWKMGPQENFGTLLMACTFVFLLQFLDNSRPSCAFLTILSAVCMSLYKESYVLVLPFFACYTVFSGNPVFLHQDDTSSTLSASQSILVKTEKNEKGRRFMAAFFSVLFLASLFLIWATVYRGRQSGSLSRSELFSGILNSCSTDLRWYILFSVLMLFIFFSYWDKARHYWREYLLLFCFLLPQMLLYIRNMTERYILPWSVGYAAMFVLFIPRRILSSGKRKNLNIILLIGLLAANLRGAIVEADYFQFSGNSFTEAMEAIDKVAGSQSTDRDVRIMTCFSPDEEGNIMIKYWLLLKGIDDVYYWHRDTQEISKAFTYDHYGELSGTDETVISLDSVDIIITANRRDRHFIADPEFDLSDFTEVPCGSMTLYFRKGAGIDIPEIKEPSAIYS